MSNQEFGATPGHHSHFLPSGEHQASAQPTPVSAVWIDPDVVPPGASVHKGTPTGAVLQDAASYITPDDPAQKTTSLGTPERPTRKRRLS